MAEKSVTEVRAVMVEDPRVPTDHLIFEGMDVSRAPHFTVSEVAKFFFNRTAHWVRWRESRGYFVLDHPECPHTRPVTVPYNIDGKEIAPEEAKELPADEVEWRDKIALAVVDGFCVLCGGEEVANSRTEEGARYYTLADIEKMAHALAGKGAITGAQLHNVLQLLMVEAKVHGYL